MSPETQVASLEMAKRLKDFGVVQEDEVNKRLEEA